MNHRTRSYLLFVLLIGCICYLVSHFVVQLYFVNGSSMEPTYTSGQPVFLQKFGLPDCLDYNDVIVIRHETLGRDIVKRIVALPGDTVQITEGILYVNGVPQPDPRWLFSHGGCRQSRRSPDACTRRIFCPG